MEVRVQEVITTDDSVSTTQDTGNHPGGLVGVIEQASMGTAPRIRSKICTIPRGPYLGFFFGFAVEAKHSQTGPRVLEIFGTVKASSNHAFACGEKP